MLALALSLVLAARQSVLAADAETRKASTRSARRRRP